MQRVLSFAVVLAMAALLAACERPPEVPDQPERVVERVPQPEAEPPEERPDEEPVQEVDTMPLTDEDFARFGEGHRDFALALFAALAEDPEMTDKNLLVSPHSILSALAMVYAGADGLTREQMRKALRLGLDEPALHGAFSRLDQALAERSAIKREDEARGFTLNVVNRLWGHHDYEFVPAYLDLVEAYYGAGIERVDFEADPNKVRGQINAWVEEQTRDRIRDLLPDGSLDEDTRLVLVNAIYFLASWHEAFEEAETRKAPFTRPDGSPTEVDMMHRTGRLQAHVGEETVAVAIPYLGGDTVLLAMMPADPQADFLAWERSLDRAAFDAALVRMESEQVALDFPKFRTEGGFRLSDLLKAMGMEEAFDPPQANFERMTGVPPGIIGRSLYIDEVFHKTFIDLDEAGTEAAAATAVVMMRLTAVQPEPEPISIRFDRPFVYAIYDQPTGTILFLGRLLDP